MGSSVGNFAEARRRLMAKIEGCEDTHVEMLNTLLAKRGVPRENYCRLNVEVGVGEFGMNEWDRLSDISTGTRRYLGKQEVQKLVYDAAVKIAKIELTKRRFDAHNHGRPLSPSEPSKELPATPPAVPSHPGAVELPGDEVSTQTTPPHQRGSSNQSATDSYQYSQRSDSQDKFVVFPSEAPRPKVSAELPYRPSNEYSRFEDSGRTASPRRSGERGYHAPPIPPKTPISDAERPPPLSRPNGNPRLPYPDTDGPPPIVNKLRKPEFSPR